MCSSNKDDDAIAGQIFSLYRRGNNLIKNFSHCRGDVKCKLVKPYCSSFYCCHLSCNGTNESAIPISVMPGLLGRITYCGWSVFTQSQHPVFCFFEVAAVSDWRVVCSGWPLTVLLLSLFENADADSVGFQHGSQQQPLQMSGQNVNFCRSWD